MSNHRFSRITFPPKVRLFRMPRRVASVFLMICLLVVVRAFGDAKENDGSKRTVIISHVNVVPMDAERVLADRTVVIEGGKIRRIVTGAVEHPKNAIEVDGRSKYLMPCLADLHVHLFSPDDLDAYTLYGGLHGAEHGRRPATPEVEAAGS